MGNTLNIIDKRRSVRKFKPDMVEEKKIEAITRAGICAASGMNRQEGVVIAVTNKEVRDKLAKANAEIMGKEMDPFYGAPVILIVIAKKDAPTYLYDGSLMLGNMMLASQELGLGSCWIHRAKETFEKKEWQTWLTSLGISGEYEGIGHLALGYVDGDEPSELSRRDGRIFYVK